MPDAYYEVVAQGARYWFLLLMALIAWRSWRWYRRDKRQAKKRLRLLPDAGFVGEMVVTQGDEALARGTVLAVPREGTLGSLRTNDLTLPANGVEKRHLWFRFDDERGLQVEPFGKNALSVDGEAFQRQGEPLYMAHGSRLYVGAYVLRLRLFAGFECVGQAARGGFADDEPWPEPQAEQQPDMRMQWMAYQQGYQEALRQMRPEEGAAAAAPPAEPGVYARPQDETAVYAPPQDETAVYARPRNEPEPEPPAYDGEAFDAPEAEEDWPFIPDPDEGVEVYDEDMTDAAAPPKSAYVGRDEAERAKRHVWDKYFGGRG